MMLSRAAGGTRVPLMFDWVMWLSKPNVYAECVKPGEKGRTHRWHKRVNYRGMFTADYQRKH